MARGWTKWVLGQPAGGIAKGVVEGRGDRVCLLSGFRRCQWILVDFSGASSALQRLHPASSSIVVMPRISAYPVSALDLNGVE